MTSDSESEVKASRLSLRIMERLVNLDGSTITELSNHLGKPKSTIHGHLTTLVTLGYVETEENAVYVPTTRYLGIGGYQRNNIEVYRKAKPKLEELADETGENAAVMIEEHGLGVVLYTAEGGNAVKLDTMAGLTTNLHTTALGKAILSLMSEEAVDTVVETHGLNSMTENTITERSRLDDELERIRSENIAIDEQERLTGLRSVAAPLESPESPYTASIGIFGPANRISETRLDEMIPKLQQAANVIEIDVTRSEVEL